MVSREEYIDSVHKRLQWDDFEPLDELPDGSPFESVYANRVKSVKLGGFANKFAAVLDSEAITRQDARAAADELRDIMTDESLNVLGVGENMLGYVVLPMNGIESPIRTLITDDYDNQKGTAFSFPVAVDLDGSEIVTHPVPRLKQRMAYSAQQNDAEQYFSTP